MAPKEYGSQLIRLLYLRICGEVFVLDMGESVKIVDIARDLITLSGLEVGKDIRLYRKYERNHGAHGGHGEKPPRERF